ncbi:hypothetical protein Gpo141_00010019 [Globisporangium polare]
MTRSTTNAFAQLQQGIYRFTAASAAGTTTSGPHVTIVGGVHGNERIGVKVLDALRLALLHVSPLRMSSGTHVLPTLTQGSVTLVYGNPAAIRIGKRGSSQHADLNRCFPMDVLSPLVSTSSLSYEQRRARELAPIFASSDVMLDLHSTNKPSEPFVRIAGNPVIPAKLSQIIERLPCEILLHDPKYLLADGQVALTDEYVGANGGLGVCYESGVASDLSEEKVSAAITSILQILQHDTQSIVPFASEESSLSTSPKKKKRVTTYEITQVFKLTEKGFRWADGVGDTNFQRVPAREPIGYFGTNGESSAAPFAVDYDAHIVFPKVPALWKVGSPLGWLTRRVPNW